jgi:hypothetical protein
MPDFRSIFAFYQWAIWLMLWPTRRDHLPNPAIGFDFSHPKAPATGEGVDRA